MKQKADVSVYLEEILDCIADIELFIEGYTKTSFFTDKKTQAAVIRNIEIIGEIVKRLPPLVKTRAPQIPWKEIAGMRDILIHEYASVDLTETWIVATVDIRKLKKQIKMLAKKLDQY